MDAAENAPDDPGCTDLLDWLEQLLGFRIRMERCPMEWEE